MHVPPVHAGGICVLAMRLLPTDDEPGARAGAIEVSIPRPPSVLLR
jgi:hypothetical protein